MPKKEETMQGAVATTVTQSSADSNVPGFINTWQNWLKIDRKEEIEKEKAEIKEKAIETFIENNPRISQLKEESTYVVKEKNADISHLMTETLANLYFEQKLYTKAIKAYEILINKNPEKKEHFKSRIQEIKEFRSKN
ncbi:tetratricopeptide repeat protein [Chryseobacterium sp. P1-3]|uniref:tetratricopeptide repeat protein n=1 Tax=Chryseobacterium sp. (strain P1-3) TaxID=1517683 RepID=UPI000678DE7A|nr:tetratricopeptide repeat protein [Chryseobacterium sp. P1-3]